MCRGAVPAGAGLLADRAAGADQHPGGTASVSGTRQVTEPRITYQCRPGQPQYQQPQAVPPPPPPQ